MPRPDRHRGPLVAAAAASLRRKGWAGTSVAEVLEAAGAPNGSLYHHFPSGKAGLAEAALDAAAARVDDGLRAAFAASPSPAAALDAWLGVLIAELRRDPRDGCPVGTPAIELAAHDDPLRAVADRAFARWTATLAEQLGGDATTARLVLSLVEGALLLDRVARSTHNLEAVRASVARVLPPA